ncbi:MAG: guanylate kinase [Desulfovibrionaceae bacterium]
MTDQPRIGQVVVLCAASGTGKSTLAKKLLSEFPTFGYSISYTTRKLRNGEVDGRDYHFVDRQEFIRLRDESFFAEWAEVHGNLYGTPREPVTRMLEAGKDVLFDIDIQGARQLRSSFPLGLYIFLLPPSYGVLAQRLAGRGSDDPQTVALRLENAKSEIQAAPEFDYFVVNDDLERAYADLRSVFLAGRLRSTFQAGLVDEIVSSFEDSGLATFGKGA